jgi:hypothetical protein
MAYPGPFPVVFSGATSQIRVSHTTFSGGVSNTGTIGAGGIVLISGAFISGGGIFDSGIVSGGIKVDSSSKIVASGGATLTVIAIANTNTFGGGISNAGTISAAQSGIQVLGTVTNFAGGVVNNGRIAGGGSQNGIFIGASTASGGIVNCGGGTISAGGGIQGRLTIEPHGGARRGVGTIGDANALPTAARLLPGRGASGSASLRTCRRWAVSLKSPAASLVFRSHQRIPKSA